MEENDPRKNIENRKKTGAYLITLRIIFYLKIVELLQKFMFNFKLPKIPAGELNNDY